MKMSRYDVESFVNEVNREVAEKYGLEYTWLGDCWPYEIHSLQNRLELCTDEESVEELKREIEELFDLWAKDEKERTKGDI